MQCYIISFDVKESKRQRLRDALKAFRHYCPIHKNCWAVMSEKNPSEIIDRLSKECLFESDERLFVIRSGTYASWLNSYGDEHNKWLKDKL